MKIIQIPSDFDPAARAEKAKALFHSGLNCCQAVVMAFEDILCEAMGTAPEDLQALATGFGGGFGRLREVCGCVSGMTFIAGAIGPKEGQTKERNAAAYALVQQMAGEYRDINGSIVCRELLGLSPMAHEAPVPSERTAEYYKKRPCEELVGIAALIAARKMIEICK